jgi:3'(2'), 5'-bisphosphate nucleotidase
MEIKLEAHYILAIEAAVLAGKAIMKVYQNEFEVSKKEDNSPITEADKAANECINTILKTTQIPIISEENEEIPFKIRKQWSRCWIVDPLDGTKEFVSRNGEFTVNIALVKDGKPVFGVIYWPEKQKLYVGDVNQNSAFKLNLTNHQFSKTLLQNVKKMLPDVGINTLKVLVSRSHLSSATKEYIKDLETLGKSISLKAVGSSLKFCQIAEGNAHLYPRFAPTMEWDTAAGHAICNAVNVKLIRVGSSKELMYNKENLYNPNFICNT